MTRSGAVAVCLMLAGVCRAGSLTLTFSETPTAISNGYSIQGLAFTWSNPTSLSQFVYGDSMGTSALGVTLLDDPILQGAADGNLLIHFGAPTDMFSFAIAVCCAPMTGGIGATVSTASSQPVPVTLLVSSDVSEGLFSYSGAPVSDAIVSFSPDALIFALDNFTFESPASNVPEPASALLAAAGLLAGLVWRTAKARPTSRTQHGARSPRL